MRPCRPERVHGLFVGLHVAPPDATGAAGIAHDVGRTCGVATVCRDDDWKLEPAWAFRVLRAWRFQMAIPNPLTRGNRGV